MIIFSSRGSSMPICRLCSTESSLYTNWVFLSWIRRKHIFVKIILSHDYDSSWTSIWTILRPFDDKYSFAQKYGLTYSWLAARMIYCYLRGGGRGWVIFQLKSEYVHCTAGFICSNWSPLNHLELWREKKTIYSYSSVLLKEHDSYTFLLSIL